jgi:hypothetical protein
MRHVRSKHDPRTNQAVRCRKNRVPAPDHAFGFPIVGASHAIGASPSLLWARTWQKQGRIQFIRPSVRVNPADVVNSQGRVELAAAPRAGGITPGPRRCALRWTARRAVGIVGIAPWAGWRGRWNLIARRPLRRRARLHIRRQGKGPGIVSAGKFHQCLHPGIDRWMGRKQVGKTLARIVDA